MSEKILNHSQSNEDWQLFLSGEDELFYAHLERRSTKTSVVTMLSRSAFYFYRDVYKKPEPKSELDHEKMVKEIKAQLEDKPLIVGITGRSGSGKSTLAQKIEKEFLDDGFRVAILSTDDYNRGKEQIVKIMGVDFDKGEKINWDSHVAYDMDELRQDLYRSSVAFPTFGRRRFNFTTSEPEKTNESIEPAEVVLVEGIMANSPVIREYIDMHFVIPTPLATCIGRRVVRDTTERKTSWSPEEILRYQLEIAEPEFYSRLK